MLCQLPQVPPFKVKRGRVVQRDSILCGRRYDSQARASIEHAMSDCDGSWTLRLDHGSEVRPLLNAEGANVSHRLREPRPGSQRLNGEKQVRHVFVVSHVQTALYALEAVLTKL